MTKLLHFAVLSIVIGLSFGNPFGSFLSIFGIRLPHFHTAASICGNATNGSIITPGQLYLSKALALLSTLQANVTDAPVLQSRFANFVSYLQNTTNRGLLTTNCTAYVIGLKAAQLADQKVERNQEKLACIIKHLFDQIAHNVTGTKARTQLDFDNDSGDSRGHRF